MIKSEAVLTGDSIMASKIGNQERESQAVIKLAASTASLPPTTLEKCMLDPFIIGVPVVLGGCASSRL